MKTRKQDKACPGLTPIDSDSISNWGVGYLHECIFFKFYLFRCATRIEAL